MVIRDYYEHSAGNNSGRTTVLSCQNDITKMLWGKFRSLEGMIRTGDLQVGFWDKAVYSKKIARIYFNHF